MKCNSTHIVAQTSHGFHCNLHLHALLWTKDAFKHRSKLPWTHTQDREVRDTNYQITKIRRQSWKLPIQTYHIELALNTMYTVNNVRLIHPSGCFVAVLFYIVVCMAVHYPCPALCPESESAAPPAPLSGWTRASHWAQPAPGAELRDGGKTEGKEIEKECDNTEEEHVTSESKYKTWFTVIFTLLRLTER